MVSGFAFVGDDTDLEGATAVAVEVDGEPALFTGAHLLSNACTHRGALLVDGVCRTRSIVCPYHGRRFGLDGAVRAAPGFDPLPEDERLPALRLARLGPMAFGSLDAAASLEAQLAPLWPRIGHLPFDALRADPASARTYELDAPWALWCENYLEGLHIPYVHPRLARAIELARYEVHVYESCSLQIGDATGDDPAFALPAGHPDAGRRIAGYYVFLLPRLALNLYPWGISLNAVEPLGPSRTRVRYRAYEWDPSLRERGAGADLDAVEREDDAVVERCARGMRARLYRPGRLHPEQERAVAWFRAALARDAED